MVQCRSLSRFKAIFKLVLSELAANVTELHLPSLDRHECTDCERKLMFSNIEVGEIGAAGSGGMGAHQSYVLANLSIEHSRTETTQQFKQKTSERRHPSCPPGGHWQ